jgi:hypothetical protein
MEHTFFSEMFTVHFYKIKNNYIQQMHLNTFIIYKIIYFYIYLYIYVLCIYNKRIRVHLLDIITLQHTLSPDLQINYYALEHQ